MVFIKTKEENKNYYNLMTDIRQSLHYANYLKSNGWTVERIDGINYFIKKLPILGSILKLQRPKKIDFKIIEKLSKKYGVFQTIIEPDLTSRHRPIGSLTIHKLISPSGFKLSRNPYLPTKTLQINLTQTKEQIYSKFSKDCKYSIRKGSGLTIKEYSTPKEIKEFRKAWKKSVSFKRFVPSAKQLINLKKNFPPNYSAFLASHNIVGSIIGGAIFTRSDKDFSYYWQAFTNYEGRTSLSQYPLLYHGLLWAKRQKCRTFDFEGIYDSRFPNKSWLGFTHFKKSFGGKEILYPGCYTKINFFKL